MAKDFNQVIIMGNLTRDPELRTTPGGQSVASFAIATNRTWQDQASGDKKDSVEFHDVVAWGKLGELVSQYLTKGRRAMVVGRLQTRNWEGTDGTKKNRTEIVASDINFIGGPSDGGGGDGSSYSSSSSSDSQQSTKSEKVENQDLGDDEINLDDIPF